jgi:hypothetical protein
MNRRLSLGPVFVLLAAACGSPPVGDNPSDDAGRADAAPANENADAAPDAISSDASSDDATPPYDASDAAIGITVSGHLVDQNASTKPLRAHPLVLLDANGKRVALTTDGAGAFTASGIVPPYDAFVPSPNAALAPTAYVALTTAHPRVSGATADPAPCTWQRATIPLSIAMPTCDTANCEYQVVISDAGLPVSGGVTGSYDSTQAAVAVDAQVGWCGPTTALLDLEVLGADSASSAFAYGKYAAISVTNAGTTDTLSITPTPVPSLGSTTFTATSEGISSAWGAPQLDVGLRLPSGATAFLARGQVASIVAGVPDIVDAKLAFAARFDDPVATDLGSSASSTALSQAPSTATCSLVVKAPPTIVSPPNGGSSTHSGTVAWKNRASDQVIVATFLAASDGGQTLSEATVYAGGSVIDLGRLSTMGLTLTTGASQVRLVGYGKIDSLDAMLDEQTLATPDGTASSEATVSFTLAP